jgi:hypothetical protein
MIATGLGSRVLVAFAAFRMETGKLAVNGRRRVQPRMRDRRCGQLSANERTGDFGPSPILVELNNEWRMLITRSPQIRNGPHNRSGSTGNKGCGGIPAPAAVGNGANGY